MITFVFLFEYKGNTLYTWEILNTISMAVVLTPEADHEPHGPRNTICVILAPQGQ